MSLHVIILAAGQGTRMQSSLPKVLHSLAGKSMLNRVLETAEHLSPETIHILYSPKSEELKKHITDSSIHWVCQQQQSGTGDAVRQVLPFLPDEARVLVLSADVPLIQQGTLKKMVSENKDTKALHLLLAFMENPAGLGRILRTINGDICGIKEEKDATSAQKTIKEIYSGICCARALDLKRWLPRLQNDNMQKEYYITDIIAFAAAEGLPITGHHVDNILEIQGVNNRLQLHNLERAWQLASAEKLLLNGVSIADANRIDIRGELECGKDVFIDINTIFNGQVRIGHRSRIGANCILTNVEIGDDCEILPHSILEDCRIGNGCSIGPFARLRPGTILDEDCKIGNFVEIKQTQFASGSKANHLSYLGDTVVGKDVNIGAGTITCNYDGVHKHQTIIEDGVFIGSDTQLIAPVKIGANATIGAGSSIRKDVPPGELTITEHKQKTVKGWKRRSK